MNKLAILLVMGGLVGGSAGVARALPAGPTLLQGMMAAESNSPPCSGTLTMLRARAPAMKMRFWRSGKCRRLEWLEPASMRGDLMVDDGVTVWTYHHSDDSALQTHRSRSQGEAELAQAGRSYQIKTVGSAVVAGRPAWVVTLTGNNSNHAVRKYWIDRSTGVRLEAQRSWRGGSPNSVCVQSISFGAVSPKLFKWHAPAGARVTRTQGTLYGQLWEARRAATWLKVPRYLPQGYYFESAVIDPGGKAWIRYTNGASPLSIFQERTGGGDKGPLQAAHGAWFWQHDDSRFLIVGAPDGQGREVVDGLR